MAAQEIIFPLQEDRCCLNIQLTARRFREWCIPFLYRVFLPARVDSYLARSKANIIRELEPFGQFVTDLAHEFGGRGIRSVERISNFLGQCPNITNLALWSYPPDQFSILLPALRGLTKLRKFGFLDNLSNFSEEQILSPPFINLTHLDIMTVNIEDCRYVTKFKQLTHLCINKNPNYLGAVLQRLKHPESGCPSLKVIVNADPRAGANDVNSLQHPYYFVLDTFSEFRTDWLDGVNGGADFWKYSEDKIMANQTVLSVADSKGATPMNQPLQPSTPPIRLIGTPGFLPGLLSHVKSSANTHNLPLENVLFQSILLCLIAGGQNLIFRVPDEDVGLVVKLTTWTLTYIFNLPTHRLKLKPSKASHHKRASSSGTWTTSPVSDPETFLYSLFMPPAPSPAPHSAYSSLSSPLYETTTAHEHPHSSSMSSPHHFRSQSSSQKSPGDAAARLTAYPFPPVPQHSHSHSAGSDTMQHFQGNESLLMHTHSTTTNNTTSSTSTIRNQGAHPPLVKPRPLYAYEAPSRLRHSNSQGSGRRKKSGHGSGLRSISALELPKALVVSGLENTSGEVQAAFASVLKERKVVIEPHSTQAHGHPPHHDKEQEKIGGEWPVPEGFITIYVCPVDAKERPKVHKSLLDHFAMSTNVLISQVIRNEFKTHYLPPPNSRSYAAFGSGSTPGSPSVMQHNSLPPSHTPPVFSKPLPLAMHHRTTSSSSQNNPFVPPSIPTDIIPSSFISSLQDAQKKVHISSLMDLYMADLFSAVRNHHRVDGSLITRRAMSQAEALVKACRVLGADLTGMELIRPSVLDDQESEAASSFKEKSADIDHEHDYLSVNMGYGRGTTIASMNTSKEHYPLLAHSPAATAEGEYPPSSRPVAGLRMQEPEDDETEEREERELDVTEVDVARIVPRVVSHRLRIRDGPDDEILSGAVFSASWKFKLKPVGERQAGEEPRLAYDEDDKLQTVKAVLVQILSQV
ncbi:hypothetical protein CVT24_000044 [Panaeolus cyanescens]|uniref:Uncharacterized protein n=1 Tax=Panaeolus cyanescens TaxID=181874 RepID=A0A409W7U5_9AGAR|nr:hypothetical protein CVT24_000044 [Panaeolus cyanescens]